MSTTSSKKPNQAHKLTAEEMESLRLQQISGDAVPTVLGNGGKKHRIPAHERHLVHARIWVPNFNPQTGEDLATKSVQTYDARDFKRMEGEQAFAGMKVEILHDGGEPAVEDIEPTDSLTPQVVSQPGAGLDLTEDYAAQPVAKLKEVYKQFFPEDKEVPTTKAALLEPIQARVAFLQDERKRQELEQIEQNRLNAAGAGGEGQK